MMGDIIEISVTLFKIQQILRLYQEILIMELT